MLPSRFAYLVFLCIPFSFFLSACAGSPIRDTPLRDVLSLDWDRKSAETNRILGDLIRIQSVRGNEKKVAEYIKNLLEKEGIPVKFFHEEGFPDRVNILAELEPSSPSSEKGLILANHLDVVEAEAKDWKEEPFSGVVKDGRIYGRGALDCKSLIAMQLTAFLEWKRSKLPLKRKIMFLGLADEESGSEKGAKFLIRKHKELFQGYGYMLNEGGFGTKDVGVPNSTIFNIQYAEKGNLWLTIRAKGDQGHGSTPSGNYPSLRLHKFLSEVLDYDVSVRISPETEAFFYQLGTASSFPNSFFLKNAGVPILQRLLYGPIKSNRQLSAITRNTKAISGLKTMEGKGHNVLASEAEAKLDIRILPGFDPKDYIEEIREIAKKYDVEVESVGTVKPDKSGLDSVLFQTVAAVTSKLVPGSVPAPFLSPGKTDNAYFREIGLECYGLVPVILNEKELTMLHGKDESVSLENLKLGTRIVFEILHQMN